MESVRRLRIIGKHQETPDTATFTLEAADEKALPAYRPGQFLSLILYPHGKEIRRAYSFSSSPATDKALTITVKRVVNGAASNWLLDHVDAGDEVLSASVAGQFVLPAPLPRRLVYLAAGSGITPVMSHLKTLLATPEGPEILLLYANRDSANTIFKKQIDDWQEQFPERFTCRYFFSREKNAAHSTFGHLNKSGFEEALHRFLGRRITGAHRRDTVFFLCAPNALMRMARMTLRVLDFPEKNIRQEFYQPVRQPALRTVDTTKTHTIRVVQGGEQFQFETFEGETILNAALRQGIQLPYTCKAGVCLTCLAQCTGGQVDLVFAESTRREGSGAMINTCIGYAASKAVDLKLE
ncbi:MAG: ferredoxin--NADP reductase [Saprospiraceae bacterium]|nr:ferredoxin--NADP reductase [Saprospiraceae bacterium]